MIAIKIQAFAGILVNYPNPKRLAIALDTAEWNGAMVMVCC